MATILICDDVSDARERVSTGLAREGHETQEVATGWELLDAIADDGNAIDLVVTDTRMGFPDGLTVATLARAAGATTPFAVLTGIASERARKIARGLGGVTLLEPPTDVERICEAVTALLAQRGKPLDTPRWVGAVDLFKEGD